MTAHKLKPCPFCGGRDLRLSEEEGPAYVICDSCETEGPVCPFWQQAANKWNDRNKDVSHLVTLSEKDPE